MRGIQVYSDGIFHAGDPLYRGSQLPITVDLPTWRKAWAAESYAPGTDPEKETVFFDGVRCYSCEELFYNEDGEPFTVPLPTAYVDEINSIEGAWDYEEKPPTEEIHTYQEGDPYCSDCYEDGGICSNCSGSGEGMVDGSRCSVCGGSGSGVSPADHDRAGAEAAYWDSKWKADREDDLIRGDS